MSTDTETTQSPATNESFFEKLVSYHARTTAYEWLLNLVTLGAVLLIAFPLFWMFSTALRTEEMLYVTPAPLVPDSLTFEHFRTLFVNTEFTTYLLNSIILAGGVVGLTTTAATLGGYGLTRLEIPHKKVFARTIIFGYMFPPILLAIPMFIFWRKLGMINSYPGLILAVTATSLPFSLWMMWKFFQTVPKSLEESAMMAGAPRFRAFYEIALPMANPGMIAVAVFSYAIAWNAYTLPTVLISDSSKWPLTVGIQAFLKTDAISWGVLMAASAIAVIPSFLFVFLLQKYLLRGFRAGGVK
jgi:multiple sugar transport system permease protein